MRSLTISVISCAAGDAGADQGRSLTSLKEKLIKIGAKVVSHGSRTSTAKVPREFAADRRIATKVGANVGIGTVG
jgi:hypothetical protein